MQNLGGIGIVFLSVVDYLHVISLDLTEYLTAIDVFHPSRVHLQGVLKSWGNRGKRSKKSRGNRGFEYIKSRGNREMFLLVVDY